MYKVICQYEDVLFGFMEYTVKSELLYDEAYKLASTNPEYIVRPMEMINV